MNNDCVLYGIVFGVYYYVILFKLLSFTMFGKHIAAQ